MVIVCITVTVAKLLTRGQHHAEGWLALIGNTDGDIIGGGGHMTGDEFGDKLIEDEVELVTCPCLTSACPQSDKEWLFATFPVLRATYF